MPENLKKIDELTLKDIASICDHTFLKRSEQYLEKAEEKKISSALLREKDFYGFLSDALSNSPCRPYALCVRPEDCDMASSILADYSVKDVKIASVVGFPDGSWYSTDHKIAEARIAINSGASEIDMVLDYKELKKWHVGNAAFDVKEVAEYCHSRKSLVKLILEACELNEKEIRQACDIATKYNVDFVKTSTGFGWRGASVEDLKIMKANFSGGIKIAGGVNIKNYKELLNAASGRDDGYIDLYPLKVRIGERKFLNELRKEGL